MVESIHQKMADIQEDIKAVLKTKIETKKFSYEGVGIWDLINMVAPILKKHEVVISRTDQKISIQKFNGIDAILYECTYNFHATDGSVFQTQSSGMGYNGKGKDLNQAQQYALKYALIQLFPIPDTIDGNKSKRAPIPKKKESKLEADYKRMLRCYDIWIIKNPKTEKKVFGRKWKNSTEEEKAEFERKV